MALANFCARNSCQLAGFCQSLSICKLGIGEGGVQSVDRRLDFAMENPKIRAVEAFPVEQQDQTLICLRDPSGLAPEPLMLGMGAYFIVTLFDGRMSLKDIQPRFQSASAR